ncbi:MAG: S46 family peptidase [Candidatus Aminicenantes bacterium]|nr:S46 family peptidase [Candidatus Aminicenantes bacterium]MDH5705608.1 S46 family peptidase [Candidatus Aminicenantes bacterium]
MRKTLIFVTILCLLCLISCRPESTQTTDAGEALIYEPGGMWLPQQVAEIHGDTLKEMGLGIDPEVFSDPLEFPLNAIISLGGCSASFISPDGLIITNYHCVRGYLQYNSTKDNNLLHTGFLAKNREEEISAGPTARVYVTTAVIDVTNRMLEGIDGIEDDLERYDEIERREKAIVKEFEEANPDSRCEVANFYGGGQYYVIVRLEIRDVRLVYAPHRGIGEFGGDIDNWMWPRHTGDFSLLRAYVGKDGKPADYSVDNVPFKPKAYLRVSKEGFKSGDLAFVIGYPGSTERLTTTLETRFEIDQNLPRRVELFQTYIDAVNETVGDDKDLEIKAARILSGLENSKKNSIGVLEGARKKDIVREKIQKEKELQKWIRSDSERKEKYGTIIQELDKLFEEYQESWEANMLMRFMGSRFLAPLTSSAVTIVRMAEERPKPDNERDPAYQERNWRRIEQEQISLQRTYSREIDVTMLVTTIAEGLKLPDEERPEILEGLFGGEEVSEEGIRQKVNALFDGSRMENREYRLNLLKNASLEDLNKSEDTLIQFALKLSLIIEQLRESEKSYSGASVLLRPHYYYALRDYYQGNIAPDANGTIRISFGTVRGYKPAPDKEKYFPFTKVSQVVEKWTKNKGEQPFDAPDSIIEAIQSGRFGSYVSEEAGEVPVNLLTDLDATGGNSGSATLNNKAEFAGILFDGNIEGVASDLVFLPDLTRSIHVDVRYILWILDAVEHADHILKEIGIEPEFSNQ